MNNFVIAVFLIAVAQVAYSTAPYNKNDNSNNLHNSDSAEGGNVYTGKFFNKDATDSGSDEIESKGQGRPTLGIFWGKSKGGHYRSNYQGMSDSQQGDNEAKYNQEQDVNSGAQDWRRQAKQAWQHQWQQQQQQFPEHHQQTYQQQPYQQQSYQQQPYQQQPFQQQQYEQGSNQQQQQYQEQPYQQQSYQQQSYQQQPYQQQPYQQQSYQQQPYQRQPYEQQHEGGYASFKPNVDVNARQVFEDASQFLNHKVYPQATDIGLKTGKFLEDAQQMYGIAKQRVFHPDEQQGEQGGRFVVNQQRHRGAEQDSNESDSVDIKNSVRGSYQQYL